MWVEVLSDKGENDIVFVMLDHEERKKVLGVSFMREIEGRKLKQS